MIEIILRLPWERILPGLFSTIGTVISALAALWAKRSSTQTKANNEAMHETMISMGTIIAELRAKVQEQNYVIAELRDQVDRLKKLLDMNDIQVPFFDSINISKG